MAEQDLGLAVLRLTVDARDAETQLNAFRSLVNRQLNDLGGGLFDGIVRDAKTAGQQVGENIAEGITKATKSLKFDNAFDALKFNPENTIKGLDAYATALKKLRDASNLSSSTTQELTDRLFAVEAALREARQSTAQATTAQQRLNDVLDSTALRRLQADSRQFAANLREQAAATRVAEQAMQQYRQAAEGAAKALANVAAKGATEALKLPLFGAPQSTRNVISNVIKQVETLKKQSETASGKTARLTEGLAVLGGGGFAAKGIIDTLGGVGGTAEKVANALLTVQERLNGLPGALSGLGGLDDVFAGGAKAIQEWAEGILRAQGQLSTLSTPLQAVTDAVSALGPEAVAVSGALAFTFAGFQDLIARSFKPGIESARKALQGMTEDTQNLLESLARAGEASLSFASLRDLQAAQKDAATRVASAPAGTEESLTAMQELLQINQAIAEEKQRQFYQEQRILLTEQQRLDIANSLRQAAQPSGTLALPSSDMLNAEGRGIQRLTPQVGPAIDIGIQEARKFTEQLIAAAAAGQTLPPIFGQVLLSLQSVVAASEQQTNSISEQNTLLQEQLSTTQRIESSRSQAARERLAAQARERQQAKATLAEQELASKRLLRLEQERQQQSVRSRVGNAVGSGIIGGAFPALFGQGIGASVGGGAAGALGGALGGQFGFGLSLVGTALGAQFDEALRKGQLLAAGLDDPIGKFQELRDASLISSRGLEKQIEALINTGRGAEAAALIQEDLLQRYGDTSQLDGLRSAFDELGRAFSQLGVLTAKFVAGPLTDFLDKLAASFTAQSSKALFDERMAALTPEQRRQVEANKSNAQAGLNDGTTTLAEAAVTYYQRQLDFIDQIAGKTKESAAAEQEKIAAIDRTNQLRLNSYRLIDAEVFGNKELTLELQKQKIELDRRNKIAALGKRPAPADVEAINTEAALKNYELTQQAAKLERQKWSESIASANRIKDIQDQIAIQGQRSAVSDVGIGALQAVAQFRAAIRNEQNAQAALREEPGNPSLVRASVEAAENTKLAAAKTKQDLLDAYKAAQDSVRSISRSIQDATLQLLRAQGGNSGINRYLSGQALYNNQKAAFQQLLPQFLAARQQAAQTAANQGNFYAANQLANLNFTGSYAQVNQQMADFIDTQRSQWRLMQDLTTSNYDLLKAQNSLAVVVKALTDTNLGETLPSLATSINNLVDKDWSIQISVAADGTSTTYGDAINSAVTQ